MKNVWLSRKMFLKLFKYVPRVGVNVLIKTRNGIVLSKRAIPPHKGYWHIPGSFLLKGEKLEEACKRVGKVELGIKIKVMKLLSVNETFKDTRGHIIDLNFLCKKVSGDFEPDKNTLEIQVFKKIPKKIFPQHDLYFKEAMK